VSGEAVMLGGTLTAQTSSVLEWFPAGRWAVAVVAIDITLRTLFACLVVVRKGSRPSVAMAWLLVVIAFPFVGILIYLLLGESRLGSRRRRIHAQVIKEMDRAEFHRHEDPRAHHLSLGPGEAQVERLARLVSRSPVLSGNSVDVVGHPDKTVEAMLADIDRAQSTVHLTTYIWLDDRVGSAFESALLAAAQRGVCCRVLADGHGSSGFLASDSCRRLRAGGVKVVAALPTAVLRALVHRIDIRNHRKLLIVDGLIGWIGSMNIAAPEFALQPRFAPWVDCMMRMHGPATRELQLIFAEDWLLDTGENLESLLRAPPPFQEQGIPVQVMASGPNFNNDAVRSLLIATLQVARREIVMTTPYFVPDPEMFGSLCVAARRGVVTHLVIPRRNNSRLVACASRARYRAMLDAGMRIHEFTGGLLHAKTITVDGSFAVITSSNLDRRSFEINFEASAIVYDARFAAKVRDIQQSYVDRSAEVVSAEWMPTLRQRLVNNAAALLSPLL